MTHHSTTLITTKGGHCRTDLLRKLAKDEEAADATEYALIVSLISLAIIGGVALFANSLAGAFGRLTTGLPVFTNF